MYNDQVFTTLSKEELESCNGGGGPWEIAIAIVGAASVALGAGWNAGRQFVKDVRDKFF